MDGQGEIGEQIVASELRVVLELKESLKQGLVQGLQGAWELGVVLEQQGSWE